MPEAVFAELELIDQLIAGLEGLIAESDESPLVIAAAKDAKRASYRILNAVPGGDRQPKTGDVIYLAAGKLIMHCAKTGIVRQAYLEVTIQAEKSARGESLAVIKGRAQGVKRVRGGYDVDVDIEEARRTLITPGIKIRECVEKGDAAGWNRWCQDIRDTLDLGGMDLSGADLGGYDLCCADLSGTDLTGASLAGASLAGANLSQCKTDRVAVTGTDFFRARMSRAQAWMLPLSGMVEVESVIFDS